MRRFGILVLQRWAGTDTSGKVCVGPRVAEAFTLSADYGGADRDT